VDLGGFLADAIVFVEIFQECISKSAPHVYLSAMTFTPESSKIYQTYSTSLHPCGSVTVQTADGLRNGRSGIPAPIIYLPSGDEVPSSFEGHVDEILSTVFVHDGYVASASYDGTIRFWDPSRGAPVLVPFLHHTGPVTSLDFSRDRMLLISGSRDGDVSVWDMQIHDRLTNFPHNHPVTCVALSPTGTAVVVGCRNGTIKFWDIQTRKECRPAFHEHTARVTAVVFLNGEIVISGSWDKTLYIHYISGHSKILARADKRIHSLAIATAPRGLVAACDSGIVIWNLSDENVPSNAVYLAKHSDEMESVAVHGTRIAAAVGQKIKIWDALSGKIVLGPFTGHRRLVTSIAFSEDGQRLVSGSLDRSVRVWDVGSGNCSSFGAFPDGSEIEPSGWIRGPEPKRDLIVWVPEPHRPRLCWGRTVAAMDGKPATYLTVSETFLGKRWYKCLI
jgi:WD40 repeat protein